MKIERWNPEKHYDLLGEWLRAHDLAPDAIDPELYPPTGYVIDDCVIGFVYLTNAKKVAYIDGVVGDPHADKGRRRAALETLCDCLLSDCSKAGIDVVWAQTDYTGLVGICESRGFRKYGGAYTCMVLTRS